MKRELAPKHVIRFAQIENKLDAATNFEAAATVPLVE